MQGMALKSLPISTLCMYQSRGREKRRPLTLSRAGDGSGEGGLYPPEVTDFQHVKVEIEYPNPAFGAALLDMYLGSGDLVPDARAKWANAAKDLLPRDSH
jgi:hypothetical protein